MDRRSLVASAAPAIRRLANRLASRPGAKADDLHQTGMEYAVRLAPEYRPELGASFQSFIYLRVRRAMLQVLRRERRELADAGDLVPTAVDSPEELMVLAEEHARYRDRIEATLATLEEVDCKLVRACHWDDLSLAEAARTVGLEYERARYRFNVAMSTMRRKLRAA